MLTTRLPSALLRRWYITIAGLMVTAGLVFAVMQLSPLTYQASTRVLLVPPVVKAGDNPYLSLSGLREVSEVLGVSMSDDATLQTLQDEGLDGKFTVARDEAAAGPIIVVTGQATSSAQAMRNRDLAAALIPGRLVLLQDNENIPSASRITSQTISVDKKGKADSKTLIRLLIVAAGLGLALTVGAVALTDRALTRRRDGRDASDDDGAQEPEAVPEEDVADGTTDADAPVADSTTAAVVTTAPVAELAPSPLEGTTGSSRRRRQRRRNGTTRPEPIDLTVPPNGSSTSRDPRPLPQGWGDERASSRR